MYQKLAEADRAKIFDYIRLEKEMNIFILGDIVSYGLSKKDCQAYAGLKEDGSFKWLLIRFKNTKFVFYSQDVNYEPSEPLELLSSFPKVSFISGKEELLSRLLPGLKGFELISTYLCACSSEASLSPLRLNEGEEIRYLKESDKEAYVSLLSSIEEFRETQESEDKTSERFLQNLKAGWNCLGLFKEGKLLSMAALSAKTKEGAMVVSVCTDVDSRKRGYASQVVSELCRQAFKEGLSYLGLFYDNPAAGAIYLNLGFRKIGKYAILHPKLLS